MYCMLLNRRTRIPATTQPAMLCLLSLVTEPCVRGVKAYVCVIRSIPLSPFPDHTDRDADKEAVHVHMFV